VEGVTATPRIRQVALVARDLGAARDTLEEGLGLRRPFADPGVGEFGLVNAVYEAGSDFLEVVAPARDGTTAGRLLERRGDGGYMAIFQLPGFDDLRAARTRVASLGVRAVWEVDLPDIASTHLHPKDVPGAIVSFDAAEPAASWRWGGPRWTGGPPERPFARGVIAAVTVSVEDPAVANARWSEVLGGAVDGLPSGQAVRFVEGDAGITEVVLDLGHPGQVTIGSTTVRSTKGAS
jgi:hypothetical protein